MPAKSHISQIPEITRKQGIPGQFKENQNNDKNTFHLPRLDYG
jgi:hypothetical protein